MSKEKQKKTELLSHNKEEALLGRRMLDLDTLCQKRHCPTSTFFLTEPEQMYCETVFHLLDSHCRLLGGYDGAERCVAILLPEENYLLEDEEIPFVPLKIEYPAQVGHRDILGSILGLGVERNAVGDILVFKSECYVFIMKDIAHYVEQNLVKVGRQNISIKEVGFDEVCVPEVKTEEINTTVASLRLDCIIAEGFRLSRETAKAAVEKQIVQLNHRIIGTPSQNVKENDVISLRGKGKIILESVSGESKKGRIWVKILRYI